MKITTKGRLAVTAMLDLALRTELGPVALATIGARQKISLSYLESLFALLRQRGLVRSTRGPGGGYCLARSAGGISVADIVRAVDAPGGPCIHTAAQPASHGPLPDQRIASEWHADLERMVLEFLGSVSLQDLAESQRGVGQASTSAVSRSTERRVIDTCTPAVDGQSGALKPHRRRA